jgi:hypothetical protein
LTAEEWEMKMEAAYTNSVFDSIERDLITILVDEEM